MLKSGRDERGNEMKFTAQYPAMQVHRAGCADLSKARNMSETRETAEAADVWSFIASMLGDETDESTLAGMGYTIDDYKVLPCAKMAK